MLAILGITLLFFGWVVFQWRLSRGVYKRYPFEQLVLVGASAAVGLAAVIQQPSALHASLFAIELAAFAMLTWYVTMGARFSRSDISLSVGDRFPDFSLPDSRGSVVDSRSLRGTTSLLLFYRGPW